MIRLENKYGILIGEYDVETEREAIEAARAEMLRGTLDPKALRYLNASYMDLRGATLKGLDLRGADFRCAQLGGADLRNADLRYTDATGADFTGADTERALRSANKPLDPVTFPLIAAKDKQRARAKAKARKLRDRAKRQAQRKVRAQIAKEAAKVRRQQNAHVINEFIKTIPTVYKGASKKLQFQARAASAALRQQMARYKELHP